MSTPIRVKVLSVHTENDGTTYATIELPEGVALPADATSVPISTQEPVRPERTASYTNGTKVWITPILDPNTGERIGSYVEPRYPNEKE